MANLLTATLDDVARKRGDLYPILATLRRDGAVVNLTGATLTITIVDRLTRIPLVLNGACTLLDAVNGRVSYQPSAAEVDVEGGFDVEFKELIGGLPFHFPSADYSALRVWPVLGFPATVPSTYNPGSIPAGTGVAGALVFTAIPSPGTPAAGLATVYVDSTTKRLTEIDDAGLVYQLPRISSGTSLGRSRILVDIDRATLAAAASYASPTWAADLYEEIFFTIIATALANETPVFTLRSVAGGYSSGSSGNAAFTTTDAAAVQVLLLNTVWSMRGSWYCKSGASRPVEIKSYANPYAISTVGLTTTSAGGATGLDITFPSNTTGKVILSGVLA